MREYVQDRVLVFGLMVAFFFGSLFVTGSQEMTWYLCLLATYLLGYSHFFIGGYYQWQGMKKWEKTTRARFFFLLFGLLTVSALTLCWYLGVFDWAATFVVAYFMLHGYFNEHTMYSRAIGKQANLFATASFSLMITGVTILSYGHASSFINLDYSSEDMNLYFKQLISTDSTFIEAAYTIGIIFLVLAIISQSIACLRSSRRFLWIHILWWCVVAGVAFTVSHWYPANFAVFWLGALSYHFLIWFVFFFRQFKARSHVQLYKYLLMHAVFIVPLVFLLIDTPLREHIEFFSYSGFFFAASAVHISLSFLNDGWCKRLLKIS